MTVSRRSFIATVGAGSAGILALPFIEWRGYENLHAQGVPSRRADRLLAAQPGMTRIDSNENPNGPGEHVFAAIRDHLTESNRYPVRSEDDLIHIIAQKHGVNPENVILGCGSGELLRAAVHGFTAKDRGLLVPEPTFEAPGNFATFLGVPVVGRKVDGSLHTDLDALVDAARESRPGLVYFCNPNNPTATVHSHANVVSFIQRVGARSPQSTILVDEAYHEYVDDPSYATVMPVAIANPRVVVLRTFSKVFGMAGLRVGYAIGQPATLAKMSPWVLGSNVTQLSLIAAAATVNNTSHIALEQKRNRETRAQTTKFFKDAGYTVPDCQANFMMVDIHRDVKAFKAECIKHKIAIGRQFTALPTHARVSLGTPAEMKKALGVFKTTLA
ncbi:MAG: aminotransferase class I/II-fold pyridoxal phosphate-dependent enzyme [bacterium]